MTKNIRLNGRILRSAEVVSEIKTQNGAYTYRIYEKDGVYYADANDDATDVFKCDSKDVEGAKVELKEYLEEIEG